MFPHPAKLSLVNMLFESDALVQGVMGLLLVASVVTWTIGLGKFRQLRTAKRLMRADLATLDTAGTLSAAGRFGYAPITDMVEMSCRELARADLRRHAAAEGVRDRISARLYVIETNAVQSILVGVNVLASIGATAPFIGLGGTVWGVLSSFVGVADAHSTNLAVVAPGIAEALLTTAMGLFAAIPAVLIYNATTRSIAGYRRLIAEASVLVACAVSCDLADAAKDLSVPLSPVLRISA